MSGYRFLEHTADVMYEAYGTTVEELFANAAYALQEIQVDLHAVHPQQVHTITLQSKNVDMLLFDFLQELIYLKDAKEVVFSSFAVSITKNNEYSLSATCKGEPINYEKHEYDVDAKAVTLHQFSVEQQPDSSWRARVIIDI